MPDPATPGRLWAQPWQVLRMDHTGTVTVICAHRTEPRANACAFRYNILAALVGFPEPTWHADVRRTPHPRVVPATDWWARP